MDTKSLRELLTVRETGEIKPFQNGMQFPLFRFVNASFSESGCILVCIISFTCSACIDLLPYLNDLNNKNNCSILLFTNGTEQENNDVISYFGFKFPVIHLIEEKFKMLRYSKTPFVYLLNEKTEVITSSIIRGIEDINKIVDIELGDIS